MEKEELFIQISAILLKLKILYNQTQDEAQKLFIRNKIKEVYCRSIIHREHHLEKISYDIYRELSDGVS